MAIKISNTTSTPALVYDQFFMKELKLTQKPCLDNSLPPVYTLHVEYQLFAVDEDNQRHFKNKVDIIHIDDYYNLAMVKAASGDYDLAQAAGAIEVALAQIIEDQTTLGTAQVVHNG